LNYIPTFVQIVTPNNIWYGIFKISVYRMIHIHNFNVICIASAEVLVMIRKRTKTARLFQEEVR